MITENIVQQMIEHWSLFEKWCIIIENYGLTVLDIRRMERGADHEYLD